MPRKPTSDKPSAVWHREYRKREKARAEAARARNKDVPAIHPDRMTANLICVFNQLKKPNHPKTD
jgi:hypothetical protein